MCRPSSGTPGKVIPIRRTWAQADAHTGLQLTYEHRHLAREEGAEAGLFTISTFLDDLGVSECIFKE